MDTEIRGLTDRFVARHTVDPALSNQWPFNRLSSKRNRPTEIFLEVKYYTYQNPVRVKEWKGLGRIFELGSSFVMSICSGEAIWINISSYPCTEY